MPYSVTCQCGKTHPVTATQAGSELRCDCQRVIHIPLLSKLRVAAGETSIPLSTLETIDGMIRRGELPRGALCPHSGRAADATIWVQVQCEESWAEGGGHRVGSFVVFQLLFGWIGTLAALLNKPKLYREFGRETSIDLPLRVALDSVDSILKLKPARIKVLLGATTIYAELLRQFPDALVTVRRSTPSVVRQ